MSDLVHDDAALTAICSRFTIEVTMAIARSEGLERAAGLTHRFDGPSVYCPILHLEERLDALKALNNWQPRPPTYTRDLQETSAQISILSQIIMKRGKNVGVLHPGDMTGPPPYLGVLWRVLEP